MPILAISAGDGQSILQALRGGAKEFLTAPGRARRLLVPCSGSAASRGARRRQRHRQRHRPQTESLVVAVLGSRGGVGCTSLAVNLGCNLAAGPEPHVALIDLDLALGDADVALDLIARLHRSPTWP